MFHNAILARIVKAQDPKPVLSGKYGEIQSKKFPWVAFPLADVDPNPITQAMGTHETVQKAIALAVGLELPVGHLALDGAESSDIKDMKAALTLNALDEKNHYQGFQNASVAYDVPYNFIEVADNYANTLMSLQESFGIHPVLLAGYVELSVFFTTLGILRLWGSIDMKRLVHYVSKDESTHVLTNYGIIDDLGIKWPSLEAKDAVDKVRHEIVNWLTSSLTQVKKDQEFWIKQSDSLAETRTAPGLAFTQTANFNAFFENERDY